MTPGVKVTSPAFKHLEMMPARFTCDGLNMNPPLEVSGVPDHAITLAIIMDDPDAPRGTWTHWLKFNLPPETKIVEEGKEPVGVAGKGTSGNLVYEGPCPPSGTHRYFFKIFALDTTLSLLLGAMREDVERAFAGHVIAEGELVGLYARSNLLQ